MSFTDEQKQLLSQKLDPKNVKTAKDVFGEFIEGWHAIAEANRIFGFDGWSYEIISLTPAGSPQKNQNNNHAVSYLCQIKVTVDGVTREDVGFGNGFSKQLGDAYESATKEAVTDALKRALRSFGNPFGLALYDKSKANVGKPEPITLSKEKAREVFDQLVTEVQSKETPEQLGVFLKSTNAVSDFKSLPDDWKKNLGDEIKIHREKITPKQEAAE